MKLLIFSRANALLVPYQIMMLSSCVLQSLCKHLESTSVPSRVQ